MNTFFSTLASSTGGLISVIAAFLISKILSKEETFSSLDEELDLTIISAKKFKNRFENINITYYIQKMRDDGADKLYDDIESIDYNELKDEHTYFLKHYSKLDKFEEVKESITKLIKKRKNAYLDEINKQLKKIIEKDAPNFKTPEEYLNLVNFPSSFETRLTLKIEDNIFKCKNYSNTSNSLWGIKKYTIQHPELKFPTIRPTNYWSNLYSIRDEFHDLRIEVEEFINKTKLTSNKIKSFSKQRKEINIFCLFIFLFFIIGMIYPLSFLKYDNTIKLDYSLYKNFLSELFSISGMVLFLISVVFLGFIGRIIYINNKLIFNKAKLNEINNISKYEYHSIYLQNYYKNTDK